MRLLLFALVAITSTLGSDVQTTVVFRLERALETTVIALEPFENDPAHCSGVVFDTGIVVSAAHCLGDDGLHLTAGPDPSRPLLRMPTEVLVLDRKRDLLWLRPIPAERSTVRLSSLSVSAVPPRVADHVLAVGFGRKADDSHAQLHFHQGVVSEVDAEHITVTIPGGTCPGDSGGPLLTTAQGKLEVLGVLWASAKDHSRDVYSRLAPSDAHRAW